MFTVNLSDELDDELNELAKKTHRTKSHYVRVAIIRYLEEREDYQIAMERAKENSPTIPWEIVREEAGLLDDDLED